MGARTAGSHGGSMDIQIGGVDTDRLIAWLRAQPLLTRGGARGAGEGTVRADGRRAPAQCLQVAHRRDALPGADIHLTDWDEVDRIRAAGGIPSCACHRRRAARSPARRRAPKGPDGKYVPLPAGFDREWVDYIKAGKVPLLLRHGRAGLSATALRRHRHLAPRQDARRPDDVRRLRGVVRSHRRGRGQQAR